MCLIETVGMQSFEPFVQVHWCILLTYTMSLVHVFCSMESYWRMLHSVYRLALFSGPQGPVSLCHWMPLTMYPWCSKIHLFDLPLRMTDLGCTFPPSFQVDAGSGLDSQDKFMNLNFVSFIQHIFMTKSYPKGSCQV